MNSCDCEGLVVASPDIGGVLCVGGMLWACEFGGTCPTLGWIADVSIVGGCEGAAIAGGAVGVEPIA